MSTENGWVRACALDDILVDDLVTVTIGDRRIAVYRLSEGVFATDGACTHEQADLGDGYLEGTIIECPKHNARFDVRTGKVKRKPAKEDLRTYEVKTEGGEVFVRLGD